VKTSKVVAAICLGLALAGLSVGASSAGTDAGIEVGFSPGGSGEALVLRSIRSARQSIRVAVVVDYKNNLVQDRSGKARAALNTLVNAGIPTFTVSAFPIQHSKYAVIDGALVQTGSYNYLTAAARYNPENVLVLWNQPDLARQYLDNWQMLYSASQAFKSTY
jgi:phosphatidylserine/phosphatidylglycerophosphate/cardiolipin synthase-like enzyme